MSLSPQFLDELRARTVLSALIGKSIKVTRAGREFKACCPFHNEKTPSFTINDDKGFYHCFGCGAHGDAIRWMTDQRGLPFMEAVKELADTAGMAVPAPDPRAAQRAEKAHSLRDVTEAAAVWYCERLADDEGTEARAYLAKRGLTRATVEAFGIGFAPDARGRMREVLKPFGDAMAIEAGMLIQPQDDAPKDGRDDVSSGKARQKRDPYDRFRGRLMIPIRDVRGRTIGFGGRILGAGEPKYLNSPDTPLFDKGRVLYNLDRAAPAARAAERLIIVEGYMDVIALAQAGIGEAVAPLGTALTEAQIELAWRQVPVPLLAFDGDAAGQRAALRAAGRALPLLRPGYSLAFVRLPPGQDPDDIVKSGGRAAMDALVASAIPLVDLLWQQAQAEAKNDTPEERAGVRARLMEQVETIADKDVAAHYRQAYRDRLDQAYFQRPQRAFVPGEKRGRYAPPVPPTPYLKEVGSRIDTRLGDAIITGLLRHPDQIAGQLEPLSRLRIGNGDSAALLDALLDLGFEGKTGLDSDALLAILAHRSVYNKAIDLMRADRMMFSFTQSPPAKDEDIEPARRRAVRDLAAAIDAAVAWPEVEDALLVATAAARTQLDEASFGEQQRLLRLKQDLTERLATLADGDAT